MSDGLGSLRERREVLWKGPELHQVGNCCSNVVRPERCCMDTPVVMLGAESRQASSLREITELPYPDMCRLLKGASLCISQESACVMSRCALI